MDFARLRQPALSALAVLLISGAGIAFAGNGGTAAPAASSTTAPVHAVAPPTVQADQSAEPTAEPAEPAGPDTDTLQEGDQTTPDGPADRSAEAAGSESEKADTEKADTEKAGVEEPGDENLPGGGHADDPNDPNVDHQFEGVE